ncbi:SH3 domain-containing protein [Mesorhizobium sp. LjNodule214]|uniref:SH3 domain-containing protein n=1 Tax=Mesorhizobium sp. LjNodule214 TaxID=3342252 RepID=UPI003ECCB8BC
MNEPFSFGAPERRRFAMQFGYEMRPTFWQGVRSNSHLVIAAVGTAALLGVAGVALWLALPANDRQAIASPEQTVPAVPVKTTKIAPPTANATVAVAAPQAARKADAVSPAVAAKEANIPALAANDPRWSGADTEATTTPASTAAAAPSGQAANQPADESAKPSAAAFAEPAAKNDATTALSAVAAPEEAATDDSMDGAQTAAIPTPKPQVAAASAAASEGDDSQAQAKPQKASAATGRILKAVTMRAGPKQKAAAMLTVPAKTSVQVISCKKWCQIVYNGKRGWIYKTYIKTGA